MVHGSEVLITGGNGFIGAHLAKALLQPENDNRVTVLDMVAGEGTTGGDLGLADFANAEFVEGSVVDPECFSKVEPKFDYIVHAAGFLGINKVAEQQGLTLDTNITGTRNLLEFAARHDEKPRVVYFSTSEIYGVECAGPTESDPVVIPSSGDRWCYATSKIAGEYYLRAYNQSHGIGGGIVRPFNVFGPHRYGSNAMTTLVNRAIRGEELTVSGDGQQVRSWCYIDDFCAGVQALLAHDNEGVEAFNIGDDTNVLSLQALAEKIISLAGSSSNVRLLQNAIEDVRFRIPNIDKARAELGYDPAVEFDEAISRVIDWARTKVD